MPLAINMVNLNVDDMYISRQRERYQKTGFTKKYPKIPDDSEKIRYGLSIAEKYWVGSGIGYPPDKGWPLVMRQMFHTRIHI